MATTGADYKSVNADKARHPLETMAVAVPHLSLGGVGAYAVTSTGNPRLAPLECDDRRHETQTPE